MSHATLSNERAGRATSAVDRAGNAPVTRPYAPVASLLHITTREATMLRRAAFYTKHHHLALFALFLSLGGTSFAAGNALLARNSVGTAQVINGSLQTNDLSKGALKALKGNTGPRGSAGAQGAQGSPGAQGVQGPPGATGVQGVQAPPGQP